MWAKMISLAWRNIWRQKRRTILTLSAISLGLGSLIFLFNLGEGMQERIITLGTNSLVGDAQYHAPDYLTTGDPDLYMKGVDAMLETARAHPQVTAVGPRIFAPVLAAMGDRSASLTLMGMEPDAEAKITNWQRRVMEGSWFTGKENQVMIGTKLAEKLELTAGSKLVLTASDWETGDLSSLLVRVVGILSSENAEVNAHMVLVPTELANRLLGLNNAAHELVFKINADLEDQAALETILASIAPPNVEAIPWQGRMVALLKGMEVQNKYMVATFAVVFILAALGIANTMGMSILERIREFGVLQAIGTTPREMAGMVVLEFTTLGALGALAGLSLGLALTYLTMHTGIPMTDVEVVGMVLNEKLKPVLVWDTCLRYTTLFAALVPLLSILPVRKVLSYDPATSIRFNG